MGRFSALKWKLAVAATNLYCGDVTPARALTSLDHWITSICAPLISALQMDVVACGYGRGAVMSPSSCFAADGAMAGGRVPVADRRLCKNNTFFSACKVTGARGWG